MDDEKKTPVRILIINLHSSWNAGDEALLEEAILLLRRHFPSAKFTLAMNDPESYRGAEEAIGSFVTWVKTSKYGQIPKWCWQGFLRLLMCPFLALLGRWLKLDLRIPFLTPTQERLIRAYLQADLVISCAGNFLYGSGKVGVSLLLALFSIYFAHWLGKPIYTLPQTLGPFRRKWEGWLVQRTLSKVRMVLVRDSISAQICAAWGDSLNWRLVPDLSFVFTSTCEGERALQELKAEGIIPELHRPLLGVTLIDWGAQNWKFGSQNSYEKAVEAAIRHFLNVYGGKAVLFAQVQGPSPSEDDRIPARRLCRRLQDLKDQVILFDRWLPPRVLKATYRQMDLFLGSRLHSVIFALTEYVPVVAISYQYKTRGVLRMLGMEQWVLDIGEVTADNLIYLLDKAWKEREQIRGHLRELIPHIQKEAAKAVSIIARDYADFQEDRAFQLLVRSEEK